MTPDCAVCKSSDKNTQLTSNMSIGSFLLMVIIPKCPFCVMAYSSAITMCGGQDFYLSQNNWISYIPSFMAILITILIAIKFKGTRSYVSLTMAFLGLILIELAHQTYIPKDFYTLGTVLSFVAIWVNGSFVSFIRQVGQLRKVQKSKWLV